MKNRKVIPSLFVSLLIVLSAAAQNPDGPTTNELSLPDQIAAARRQYTETTDISPDPNAGKALAQLPRGGPPMMPRQGYYRGSYQNPLMRSGNAGHTLIGAAIGFGLGATMGALGTSTATLRSEAECSSEGRFSVSSAGPSARPMAGSLRPCLAGEFIRPGPTRMRKASFIRLPGATKADQSRRCREQRLRAVNRPSFKHQLRRPQRGKRCRRFSQRLNDSTSGPTTIPGPIRGEAARKSA